LVRGHQANHDDGGSEQRQRHTDQRERVPLQRCPTVAVREVVRGAEVGGGEREQHPDGGSVEAAEQRLVEARQR
jgi:hypothetical protein